MKIESLRQTGTGQTDERTDAIVTSLAPVGAKKMDCKVVENILKPGNYKFENLSFASPLRTEMIGTTATDSSES